MTRLGRKLIIDSRDRTAGSASSSDFKIIIPGDYGLDKAIALRLRNITIPRAWYTIDSRNNVFQWADALGVLTTTIPTGNYIASALATELSSSMTTSSAASNVDVITVVYSSLTGKYTFSTTGATLDLQFGTGPSSGNALAEMLGFTKTDTGPLATQVSVNQSNLNNDQYILIKSPQLVADQDHLHSSGLDYGILAHISINSVNTQSFVVFDSIDEPHIPLLGGSGRTNLTFKLTYKDDIDVNMNGVDWSIVFDIIEK